MASRLLEQYNNNVLGELIAHFKYKNKLQAPKMQKIVVNMGIGAAITDSKILDNAMKELTLIVGQQPIITRAKKSIAGFKLREGMPVGCKVTLRGGRMYEFFDRLINIAVPRIRDFRGLNPKSFDGYGNYCFGLKDQLVFPEIDLDKVARPQGMDIIIATSASSNEEAKKLLELMGMPFRK